METCWLDFQQVYAKGIKVLLKLSKNEFNFYEMYPGGERASERSTANAWTTAVKLSRMVIVHKYSSTFT